MKKLFLTISSSLVALSFPSGVFASCANFSEKFPSLGAKVIPTELGPKIVSAVRTPVFVDDVDELNDAMMEAKMDAKVQISQFLNETIANECKRKSSKLSRRVISKDSSGESGTYDAEKNKEIVCSTTTSTAALLKGVVDIGQCYEKSGGYLQWAVGISPSTLMSAAELSKNINEGVKSNAKFNNSSPVSNSGTNSNGLIPTEGFSYIDDSF